MELEKTLYRVQERILSHPRMPVLTRYCGYFLLVIALLSVAQIPLLTRMSVPSVEYSDQDLIYHFHIVKDDETYLFMKYSHNAELLKLNETLMKEHNFTITNITQEFDDYVQYWDYLLYFSTNLETIFLNQIPILQQEIYVLNNATNQTFFWKPSPKPTSFNRLFTIIFDLFLLEFGLFVSSAVAALYIKMTIICAPVIIIMMSNNFIELVECMTLFGNRELQPAILARAFPWIGIYLNLLDQSHRSKKQLIIAFALMLLVFYFIYLASVLLSTFLLFRGQVPIGLVENFFGLVAINEFASMLFLHTRSSLYFLPKFILIYYMMFLLYLQQTEYGYYQVALNATLYACLGTFCMFLSLYEIPSLTWNPQSFYTPTVDRPRCYYSPIFSMTWMSDLPQLWSMFYPLHGRRYFQIQNMALMDRNYPLLNHLLQQDIEMQEL